MARTEKNKTEKEQDREALRGTIFDPNMTDADHDFKLDLLGFLREKGLPGPEYAGLTPEKLLAKAFSVATGAPEDKVEKLPYNYLKDQFLKTVRREDKGAMEITEAVSTAVGIAGVAAAWAFSNVIPAAGGLAAAFGIYAYRKKKIKDAEENNRQIGIEAIVHAEKMKPVPG